MLPRNRQQGSNLGDAHADACGRRDQAQTSHTRLFEAKVAAGRLSARTNQVRGDVDANLMRSGSSLPGRLDQGKRRARRHA